MLKLEHSTDGGRTWTTIQVRPTTVAGSALAGATPGQEWSDGFGNRYRRPVKEAPDA